MIRRRLVVAVTLTVAVAIGLGSWLIVTSLEARLIDNVDEQFTDGTVDVGLRDRGFGGNGPDRGVDQRRRVAVVQYDADGSVLGSIPSGMRSEPDPLPAAGDLDPSDGIRSVPSTEDGPRYRAVSLPNRFGGTTVVGVSLEDVDQTLTEARRIQLVVGFGAIAAVALLCWLLIRRTLSPIDGMIATAGRIAAGDLDERTEVDDPSTEVGKLGAALDTMLDRIQGAVDESTRSEERMRRFVADASHDLRTPLTSVRGYAELYRQGASDPDAVALGMERIEAEATRMSRLVDDLMLLARLDQQPTPERRPVDLGRLAGDAVDAVRVADHERTFDLDVAVDHGLVVSGDPDQLRQVFDNLLRNASAHTPPGTTVEVGVTTDGDAVVATVTDDGPGFRDADRERAFDRFWRSTRADENPLDGSGLGLSIVQSIVEAHGGTVGLDRPTGGGARFSVRFPHPPPTEHETGATP